MALRATNNGGNRLLQSSARMMTIAQRCSILSLPSPLSSFFSLWSSHPQQQPQQEQFTRGISSVLWRRRDQGRLALLPTLPSTISFGERIKRTTSWLSTRPVVRLFSSTSTTSVEEIEADVIDKWNRNEHQEAFDLIEANLAQSHDLRLLDLFFEMCMSKGDYERCEAYLSKTLAQLENANGNDADADSTKKDLLYSVYLKRGEMKRHVGSPQAKEDFYRATRLDESNPLAFEHLGATLLDEWAVASSKVEADELLDLANAAFDNAINLFYTKDNFERYGGTDLQIRVLYGKAIALQRQKKHQEALQILNEVLQIDPGHAPALLNAGECSQFLGNHPDTVKHMTSFIECFVPYYQRYNSPHDSATMELLLFSALLKRGISSFETNNSDQALKDLTIVIEMKGKHSGMHIAYHYRAKCHLKKGEYKLSILDNTEALKLNGSFISAYHDRAIAYQVLGDTDLAAKDKEVYDTLLANLDNNS